MGRDIRTRRERLKAWWERRTRVAKVALWLLLAFWICVFGEMVGVAKTLDSIVITISAMAMMPLLLILLFRWFTYRGAMEGAKPADPDVPADGAGAAGDVRDAGGRLRDICWRGSMRPTWGYRG